MSHAIASALKTAAAKPKKNGAHDGTIDWHGLKVAVEYPKGTERSGVGKDGKRWSVRVPATYGAIRGTEARDGEEVDCYIGDDHASKRVFVIDQKHADTGRYDEAKCMLGFPSKEAATAAYARAFSDGKGKDRIGHVAELSVPAFKDWLKNGDTTKPMSSKKPIDAALQLARGYAQGGRVGFWEGGDTRPDLSNVGFFGKHTPKEALYELLRNVKEEPSLPAEISGVPSIARGVSNVKRGFDEGDPIRGAGGVGETVLGAVPLGTAVRPLGSAIAPFVRTLPRYIGTSAATGALSAYSDDAKAAELNAATAIGSDPEVLARIAEREKVLADIERVNKQHARSGPETQRQALLPFQKQLDLIDKKLTEAENRARDKHLSQASFRELHPGVPAAMMAAGLGLAGGYPLVKGAGERVADAFWRRPGIEEATKKAGAAFAKGAPDAETAIAQTVLRNKLDAWDAGHSSMGTVGKYAGAMGMGALAGGEASTLPEQIDMITHEPGHPARDKAVAMYTDPDYWKQRVGPMGLGAGVGLLGAKTPGLLPQNKEFLSEAREVAQRGAEPSAVERALALMSRKTPTGPSEDAIARVKRYRTAAGPAGEPGDAMNLSERLGTAPGRDVALPAPIAGTAIAEGTLPSSAGAASPELALAQRVMSQRQLPPPEASANPAAASEAPQIIYRGKDSLGRTFHKEPDTGYFTSVPEPKDRMTKVVKKPKSPKSDDTAEKLPASKGNGAGTKEDIPVKPDRELDPNGPGNFRKGGFVNGALALARKYAGGGSVGGDKIAIGPVTGATGGRSDALPVSVPAGSFVVPADVVSALGEGNTLAGNEKLTKMFGKASAKTGMASGGHVGIKISDGEFVLSPEQVAKVGNGDPEQGMSTLDKLMVEIRKHHINTLSSLPPPSK